MNGIVQTSNSRCLSERLEINSSCTPAILVRNIVAQQESNFIPAELEFK